MTKKMSTEIYCGTCIERGTHTPAVKRVVIVLPTGPRNTRRHTLPVCQAHANSALVSGHQSDSTVTVESL